MNSGRCRQVRRVHLTINVPHATECLSAPAGSSDTAALRSHGSWESFNFEDWTGIGAMNRLRKGARLCAEHQLEQVRMGSRSNCFGSARALRLVLWTQPRGPGRAAVPWLNSPTRKRL